MLGQQRGQLPDLFGGEEMQPYAPQAALTHERLLKLAHEPEGTAVEEDSLDNLLKTVPTEDRPKFDKLRKALQEQLSGMKVYKVGDEAERNVYIVGKTKEGKWAGLKTTVVET
jgi:hypothetical protein